MRKEVGLSAGFLALLAIVVHSVFRPEAPAPTVALPHEAGGSDEKVRISLPEERGGDIEGPWLATREFFHTPERTIRLCNLEKFSQGPENDLIYPFCEVDGDFDELTRKMFGVDECAGPIHVIIATVPDPVRSRLALTTDAQIETIERAVQEAGWEFAQQWLPWNDVADPNEGNVSKRRYERYLLRIQQQLPGVLVFRKAAQSRDGSVPVATSHCLAEPEHWTDERPAEIFSRESLLIFLAGDTPTRGINGRAFRAARRFAGALMKRGDRLGILAPTFSGSFYSLTTLLSTEAEDFKSRIRVYSGGVARQQYGELLEYHTGIEFHSGWHSSADFQKAFCGILDQFHVDHLDAANLVEDETAYGEGIPKDPKSCVDVRTYRFPRDISHLRNAYREAAGAAERNAYDPLPGLDFSVRDPQTGEDSVPVFSPVQTPQSQNAILQQITEDFNRRRVRLVNITATNVLDLLFLAHVIHVESPDTRVLISDAHALFIPAVTNASMAGTLFLSSYPMMLSMSGLRPAPKKQDEAISFSHAVSEGWFNVIQFLLRDMGLRNAPRLDYGHAHDDPVHSEDHPPLWLLTVNRYGYFPIERVRLAHSDHSSWLPSDLAAGTPDEMRFLRPARSWMLLEGVLGGLVIGFCLLLFEANRTEDSRLPMWMKLKEGYRYFAPRGLSLVSLLLVLSASQWILVLPLALAFTRHMYNSSDLWVAGTYVGWGAAAFAAPLLAIDYLIPVRRLRSHIRDPKHRLHLAIFSAVALAFAALLAGWAYCSWMSGDNSRAEYFNVRALEIYSGSSPAVPILILLGVFFFIALSHFRRYSLGALNEPYLPRLRTSGNSPAWEAALERKDVDAHVEEVDRQLVRPIELTSTGGRIVVACVVGFCLVGSGLLHRHAYFSAFEQRAYNSLLVFSELAAFALLALGCVHIVRLWNAFEVLLVDFESTVYMEAITRITRSWPRRPIWSSGKFIRNPAFERQSLLALHNRKVIKSRPIGEGGKEAKQFEDFYRAVKCMREACSLQRTFASIFDTTRKYYVLCRDTAEEILHDDLFPFWLRHVMGERAAAATTDAADDTHQFVRAGADFVVLQMARYFVFVAVQIQRIAWTLSITMVLLLIAFNTYSVQAPQTVGRVMAACFLMIGFFVVRVFAGLERNPILSRIAGTRPGKLTWEFYTHIAALGALPLIGVLAHLFPSVGSFLSSWVAPGVESLH
jgi:hypothetical protein